MVFWIIWACALATAALGAEYKVGQKFQIILSNVVVAPSNTATKIRPTDAAVFDVDAFETDASTIALLQAQGKIVICYFSAGTYEPYRSDSGSFTASDKGHNLPEWPDEYWLKVTSANVRKIMTSRIQMAAAKGCDGVDPDNTDGYANPSGNTTVSQSEAVDYIHFLAGIASGLNMTIGLKNSLQILSSVSDVVSFAVNEQCGFYQECYWYKDFLAAGKPVYQIEYPTPFYPPVVATRTSSCAVNPTQPAGLSLVFKNLTLDGYVAYCDGSTDYTDTKNGGVPPKPPKTTTPSSSRPTITSKSSTSYPHSGTTTTSSRTSQTSPPSSSPTGNPGCTSKHWDQCGGQDWKGCTVCASGFTCKYSNPYYSQCL